MSPPSGDRQLPGHDSAGAGSGRLVHEVPEDWGGPEWFALVTCQETGGAAWWRCLLCSKWADAATSAPMLSHVKGREHRKRMRDPRAYLPTVPPQTQQAPPPPPEVSMAAAAPKQPDKAVSDLGANCGTPGTIDASSAPRRPSPVCSERGRKTNAKCHEWLRSVRAREDLGALHPPPQSPPGSEKPMVLVVLDTDTETERQAANPKWEAVETQLRELFDRALQDEQRLKRNKLTPQDSPPGHLERKPGSSCKISGAWRLTAEADLRGCCYV